MSTKFPEALDTFDNPEPDSSQAAIRPHSQQHGDANDALEALQQKIGVDLSTVPESMDFKIGALENVAEGLDSAAFMPATAFATATQGQLAATAVQPSGLESATNELQVQIDGLVDGQQTSAIYADTLEDLQAVIGTYVGQGAFVANGAGAGQYSWDGAAWQFLRADVLTQKADKSEVALKADQIEVDEINATLVRTDVPGYLAALVDTENRMTDLAVRASDGQVPEFVMRRWGNRLGVLRDDVPGYMLALTDPNARMTDLAVRASDGQLAEYVIKRLAPRIAKHLDLAGDVIKPASYGLARLRAIRMRLAQISAGDVSQLDIAFVGDSWTAGSAYWLQKVTDHLVAGYGSSGYGFVGCVGGAANSQDIQVSTTGAWTVTDLGTASPNNSSIVSGAVDDYWQIVCRNGFTDHPKDVSEGSVICAGTGTVSYRWGTVGEWTDVGVANTGPTSFDLANFPAVDPVATNAWVLQVKVDGAGITLYGAVLKNAENGIRAHKMARGNTTAANWIGDSAWTADFVAAASPIPADAYFVMFGMNDQSSSVPADVYLSRMQEIVANLRTINPAADIHLCVQPRTTIAGTALFAEYFEALRQWAYVDGKIAVTNLQEVFGPDYANYAQGGNFPLIDSTNAHPTATTGGRIISETMYRIITKAAE